MAEKDADRPPPTKKQRGETVEKRGAGSKGKESAAAVNVPPPAELQALIRDTVRDVLSEKSGDKTGHALQRVSGIVSQRYRCCTGDTWCTARPHVR